MKIALAQLNFHIGNFELNTQKIIAAIHEAKKSGADLVVFPELAISGYPPRDFLEFSDFIERCYQSLDEIVKHTQGIGVIVGCPSGNPDEAGKDLFNSAYFLADKKVLFVQHKSLLPNYDVFDEYRYFEPNRKFEVVEFRGRRIALTICEDLWNVNNDPMYIMEPMAELIKLNPDLIINISASPFDYNQHQTRLDILRKNALKYKLPVVYVNHVGAHTELIFDGGSLAMDAEGIIRLQCPFFKEAIEFFDTEAKPLRKLPHNIPSKTELIYKALVLGVKDYFAKMKFKTAVLGLSGGIDSALTLVIASEALGNRNVYGVLMPSKYSSRHSVQDALDLAANLNCHHKIIPIKDTCDAFEKTLRNWFIGKPADITEENIQARIRAVILMALSNKFGHIVLNTSNKSEAAVGYGTLYGDMCGGISVLGDVYKTQVYELAHYVDRNKEIIPISTIMKPPSAELRPDQKDSDSLPDYGILDEILFQYIEKRMGPNELIAMGYEAAMVHRILKLVNTSEYKRYQTPPILRVSPKAFGMGRRLPIVGKYLS
jgi:NAD+ synthase (glutamine-hydrolysing)